MEQANQYEEMIDIPSLHVNPLSEIMINISNYSSKNWDKKQLEQAKQYWWAIIDIPFPAIDTKLETVEKEANKMLNYIRDKYKPNECVIHLMGEQSFCYSLTNMLHMNGYTVLVSITKRITIEENGIKKSIIQFIRFRELENPFKKLTTFRLYFWNGEENLLSNTYYINAKKEELLQLIDKIKGDFPEFSMLGFKDIEIEIKRAGYSLLVDEGLEIEI